MSKICLQLYAVPVYNTRCDSEADICSVLTSVQLPQFNLHSITCGPSYVQSPIIMLWVVLPRKQCLKGPDHLVMVSLCLFLMRREVC